MVKQLWMGVAVLLVLCVSRGAQAQEASAVGTYQASLQGATVTMVVKKDGTAVVEGESARWTQLPGQLVFVDGGGERFVANYDGDTISLSEGGLTLEFKRVIVGTLGNEVKPQAPQPRTGDGYRPGKPLKGKTYRVKGANASFTLPKGFTAKEGVHQGQEGIIITKKRKPEGFLAIAPKLLSASEAQQRVSVLLEAAAQELVGDTPVDVLVPPQDWTIPKNDAAYLELSGTMGGQQMRAKLGGIRIGRWGAVFVALYPANQDGTYAPLFDTVFNSFKAKPPKENRRLAAQLAGCWETVTRSGGVSGSAYSETRYHFGRDGSYSYSHMTSVSVPGGAGANNISEEAGSFAVFGNSVSTTDNKSGASSTFNVRLQRGFLLIGSTRYTPCT